MIAFLRRMAWTSLLVAWTWPLAAQEHGTSYAHPRVETSAAPPERKDESAASAQPVIRQASSWLHDSRWYEVNLATFGGAAKTSDVSMPRVEPALRAVRERLEYIRNMGFNVVVLSGWSAVSAQPSITPDETMNPVRPVVPATTSDPESKIASMPEFVHTLNTLLDAAHHSDMRIVLSAEAPLIEWALRLERVDGWRWPSSPGTTIEMLNERINALRRAVPHAAMIVVCDGYDGGRAFVPGEVDAVQTSSLAQRIAAFAMSDRTVSAGAVMDAIERSARSEEGKAAHSLHLLCGDEQMRLMSALMKRRDAARDVRGSRLQELAAWRLTVMTHALASAMPLIRAGEEVGMTGDAASLETAPLWWGVEGGPAPDPGYRADFRAVVRLANQLHATHEPLRKGTFRNILADDERHVLVFGRMLGRREVIVVVNAATTKQQVEFQVGPCEEGMVGVIRPELEPTLAPAQRAKTDPFDPVTAEPVLRFAGNRAMVDEQGRIRLHLDPMSVKLVIVNEAANR